MPMEIPTVTPADQPQSRKERRNTGRLALQLPGGLRRSGDRQKPVTLAGLSAEGCSVKDVINLRVGERVWVRLPGLEGQQAQIRWTGLGTAGLAFDRPLHAAVVERIRALGANARVTLGR